MMKNNSIITVVLGITAATLFYIIGRKNGRIQGLENEILNDRDMINGQRKTIDMLNYALGKKSVK